MTEPKFHKGQKVRSPTCGEFIIGGMYWCKDDKIWIYHDGYYGWRGYEMFEEEEDLTLVAKKGESMAELILTEEEKNSSYIKWDDAAYGKACKQCLSDFETGYKVNYGDKWMTMYIAAASLLVDATVRINAAESDYSFKGFSVSEIDHGNWEVIVRKKMHPLRRLYQKILNWFSRVERLKLTQTNNEQGKITDVSTEWKNKSS